MGDTWSVVLLGCELSSKFMGETNLVSMESISGRWHAEQVFTYLKDPENLEFMDEI